VAPPTIHPTAVVSSRAALANDVAIGPLCIVDEGVSLGAATKLLASSVVLGPLRMGERNTVFPYAVLGGAPQDRSYAGEPTTVAIGSENVFREHVTVHRGTTKDRGTTSIGSSGLFMAGVHVAHDVVVGDHVTLANDTLLAGHVHIAENVTTGGAVAVAPFVWVGRGAFIAAGAMVERDVPPFVIAAGDRARVRALNQVGLERLGVGRGSKTALEHAFRAIFVGRGPRSVARRMVETELGDDPWVLELLEFLDAADVRQHGRAGVPGAARTA
jgi:UDP-N-acetylglucosamine acyltransferase